jgi:hypothetical protein
MMPSYCSMGWISFLLKKWVDEKLITADDTVGSLIARLETALNKQDK